MICQPQPVHEVPENWAELYVNELRNYAVAKASDPNIADDALQDTFVAALENLHNYRGEGSFKSWLFVILRRKLVDCYRRNKKFRPITQADNFDADIASQITRRLNGNSGAQSPDEEAEYKETVASLRSCVDTLPRGQKDVWELKFELGHGSRQICQQLDISHSNLWVRTHRLRRRLSLALADSSTVN